MLSVVSLVAFVRAMPANAAEAATSVSQYPDYPLTTVSDLGPAPTQSVLGSADTMLRGSIKPNPDAKILLGKREVNAEAQVFVELAQTFDEAVEGFKNKYKGSGDRVILLGASATSEDHVILLAYRAASKDPSPEVENYAYGFNQYFDHEFPEAAKLLADKTKGDKFLWFMGIEGNDEAKKWFIKAYRLHFRGIYPGLPLYRFDTPYSDIPNMSLEAYVWLRNFEQMVPPTFPDSESKDMRLNRIVGAKRMNYGDAKILRMFRVFDYLYELSHKDHEHIPNFLILDADVKALFAEATPNAPIVLAT